MGSYSFYQEPLRSDELYHHGIKGQKWGVRRFQQTNGTLTSAGKRRYLESLVPTSTKRPANAMGGPGPLRRPSNARADRARQEAQTAHKLATAYKNRMGAKAAKRQAQADASGKRSDKARADRAKQEAKTANKLADKYTSKMDAKAAKRQAQADEKANNPNVLKQKWDNLSPKQKTAIKVGAAVAAAGIAAYGGYKLNQHLEIKNISREFADRKILNSANKNATLLAKTDMITQSRNAKSIADLHSMEDKAWNKHYDKLVKQNMTADNRKKVANELYGEAKKEYLRQKSSASIAKNKAKEAKREALNARERAQREYLTRNLPKNVTDVDSTVRNGWYTRNKVQRYRFHDANRAAEYYKPIMQQRIREQEAFGRKSRSRHGAWKFR